MEECEGPQPGVFCPQRAYVPSKRQSCNNKLLAGTGENLASLQKFYLQWKYFTFVVSPSPSSAPIFLCLYSSSWASERERSLWLTPSSSRSEPCGLLSPNDTHGQSSKSLQGPPHAEWRSSQYDAPSWVLQPCRWWVKEAWAFLSCVHPKGTHA